MNKLLNNVRVEIPVPITQILEKLDYMSPEKERIIQAINELINSGDLHGEFLQLEEVFIRGETKKKLIGVVFSLPPFYCQLCETKHSAGTGRYQCQNCARFICTNSFLEMKQAGRMNCPMCTSPLTEISE